MPFCSSCGSRNGDDAAFCDNCGKPLRTSAAASTVSAPTGAAPAMEKKFYESQGILVTNSRFIVDNQTFTMHGVTSVSSHTDPPSRKGPIITIIVGLIVLLGGLAQGSQGIGAIVFGLIISAAGIFWFVQCKPVFHVLLRSASGEQKPLHSKDEHVITEVIKALNEAIVFRS